MTRRSCVGLGLLLGLWAGCPAPVAPAHRPAARARLRIASPPRRPPTARPPRPLPRPPSGPDIRAQLDAVLQIGALRQVDKRLARLLPAPGQAGQRSGILTRLLLPALAQRLGCNSLALDALDLDRASAFALLLSTAPGGKLRAQLVGLIPIKGDGQLVVAALRASYTQVLAAPWGDLQVKRQGQSLGWVGRRGRWLVLAPTAPLIDSAHRALLPLTKNVPEGSLEARLRTKPLLRILGPLLRRLLSTIKGQGAAGPPPKAQRPAWGLLGRLLGPQTNRLLTLLGAAESVEGVALTMSLKDTGLDWRLRVTPSKGGRLARWIRAQKPAGSFGLNILPRGAALAWSDWSHRDLRSALHQSLLDELNVQSVRLAKHLPPEAAARGLMKRRWPASRALYRRYLRDLNLADLGASYGLYRVVFGLRQLRAHLKRRLPNMIRFSTGASAAALYFPRGPGLGIAAVEQVRNVYMHWISFKRAWVGNFVRFKALLAHAFRLVPEPLRRVMGRGAPVSLAFQPLVAQVGGARLSAVSLRVRWPSARARARARTPPARAALAVIDSIRRALTTIFGAGPPTYAWAYVGRKMLTTAGHGWRASLKGMVRRAKGWSTDGLSSDPHYQASFAAPGAKAALLQVCFSIKRLNVAFMEGLKRFWPAATGRASSALAPVFKTIERQGQSKGPGSCAALHRQNGGYLLQGRLPSGELRALVTNIGGLLFAGLNNLPPTPTPVRTPAPSTTPPTPHPPRRSPQSGGAAGRITLR